MKGWQKPAHVDQDIWAIAVKFGQTMREAAGWEPEETDEDEEFMADAYAMGACDAWLVLRNQFPFG